MRLHHHARTTGHHLARNFARDSAVRRRFYSADAAAVAAAAGDDGPSPVVDRIASSLLGYHWDTRPPGPEDLKQAATFFRRAPPTNMYTASSLYQVPYTGLPEVAFLGRSNVGKSTLLNALLSASVCRTSSKPGRTRALHAYAVGGSNAATNQPGLLAVLDMPGYGHGSRAEWGQTVARYLARRKELRRAFLLVDALHGLKQRDELMLQELRRASVPHQVVLSKVDRIILPQHAMGRNLRQNTLDANVEKLKTLVDAVRKIAQPKDARAGLPAHGEILCVSADMGRYGKLSDEASGTMGINALRWSVLMATGFTEFGKKLRDGDDADPVLIDTSR